MWFLERLDLYNHTKPYMITFDTSDFPGEKTNHSYSKHAVKMADARQTSSTPTINRNGFEFRRWASELRDDMFDNKCSSNVYIILRSSRMPEPLCHNMIISTYLLTRCGAPDYV